MTQFKSHGLLLPDCLAIKNHVAQALNRYWSKTALPVKALPVRELNLKYAGGVPLKLVGIRMPPWAQEFAVQGELLVPAEAVPQSISTLENSDAWMEIDWFLAVFLLLECWHERSFETFHGPIHSYSFRLKGWDSRVWEYAWVNRIALFLRSWAAQSASLDVSELLGDLPNANVLLTHDVDAVSKTWSIRVKQSLFILFRSVRSLKKLDIPAAIKNIKKAAEFFLVQNDWSLIKGLSNREKLLGVRATYHFYGGGAPTSFRQWLFDPGYDLASEELKDLIVHVTAQGHEIGLHPGYDNWHDPTHLSSEIHNLNNAISTPVYYCRQHWLRFSWEKTWPAQSKAGLRLDTTLMFNDRPGFRNASAVKWAPWKLTSEDSSTHFSAMPTMVMDSHLYDYLDLTPVERKNQIERWFNEVALVRGEVAVLWHPHTLAKDYDWTDGFDAVLRQIALLRS